MIETIDDTPTFEALRAEWTELLEDSVSNCLFLTWEWLFTWWKHLAAERRLSILTVRNDGRLIAIVPLMLTRRFSGSLPFDMLEFLGTGTVSSDHLDLIVRRGREAEAIGVLADHLAARKLGLKLIHYNRGSSLVSQLAAHLCRRGSVASEATLFLSPLIRLKGHSWESYLATLDHDYRHELRRRLRKLNREFSVRIEEALTEKDRGPALSLLYALHEERWRERGGSAALYSPALRNFYEEATRLALERGWLRLFVMWLDGKPAAARCGFKYGSTYYSYQSGFDPAFARQWVGVLSFAHAIKSSIEEGAEEHDLLAGNEEYKFRLAPEARELGRLELYPPGMHWLIYRHAITLYRAARSTAHRNATRVANLTRKFA